MLRPLLDERGIVAATLADVGSGLLLDGWTDTPDLPDVDLLAASHVDMVRAARGLSDGDAGEVTVVLGACHHLLADVPDPHGDRLVLAVVVHGGRGRVARARRRLREATRSAGLTAGPDLTLRPVEGTWRPPPVETVEAPSRRPAPPAAPLRGHGTHPAPPSAMPDAPHS